MKKNKKLKEKKTIEKLKIFVNAITLFRLFGAFILIPIYYIFDLKIASIFSLTLFLTDLIDGFLARKFKVSTFFGSSMDALSDKALGIISLGILSSVSPLMFVPLAIEILVPIVNLIAYKNNANIKSSRIGKIKTWALGITVIGSFITALYDNNSIVIISYLAALATTFGILTLIDYIGHAYNSFKDKHKLIVIDNTNLIPKSFKEILRDAWDCEFYKKYKDESIRKLIYKKKC